MKQKNKGKITALIIVFFIAIGIGVYFFLKEENRLSPEERAWLSESTTKIQNIHIINDENIFGNNGKGIFYSFLQDFQENYNLSFNTITFKSTETSTGPMFGVANELPSGALNFYTDHYVYVSKQQEKLPTFESLKGKKVGIIKTNETHLSNYLKSLNLQLVTYNTREDLLKALSNGTITSIIVPRMEYLDTILENNYQMNYHFSDVSYYYYMNDVEDSRLKSIMKKYFQKWSKKEFLTYLAEEEQDEFLKGLKIEEKDLINLQGTSILYGLVNNSPYEVLTSGNVGGIMTEYIKKFSAFSNIDIEYNRYSNAKKLIKEINNDKIKLYMNYFTQVSNGTEIPTNIYLNYSIYAHESNPLVIHSLEALKDQIIYVEENTLLETELKKIAGLTIRTYSREKEWNKIIKKKDTILAIDTTLGEYYHNHDLKKFQSIYQTTTTSTYALKSLQNDTFNTLLTKYINYLDNNQIQKTGIYENIETEQKGSIISKIAEYAIYFIVIIGLILGLIYYNSKKVRLAKKIKKEDKLKYIDQLTSLKNRNYLNENMASWNKNTVYPQSVIMIDLNKLQEINDTLGYEEGDKQIQGAANILIRTQLDNTDIIRTDGTEFMVYLVGYNQKQVTSYMHKLNKEFKTLPQEHGVSMGYSMIEDNLKNIQDAINECVEDIKNQKEEQREEKE